MNIKIIGRKQTCEFDLKIVKNQWLCYDVQPISWGFNHPPGDIPSMAEIRQPISDVGVVVYGCFWWLKNHIMIPKYEYVG